MQGQFSGWTMDVYSSYGRLLDAQYEAHKQTGSIDTITDEVSKARTAYHVAKVRCFVRNLEDAQDANALNEDKARMDRGEAEFVPWEDVRDKIGSEYKG